jgi:hypothetical protein
MSTLRALTELLALDRGSVRSFDEDGRLRVATARISRAGVNEYLGSEIPRWKELGLDGARRYRLLRHPDELAKAVDSFNGLPLLRRHQPHSANDHRDNADLLVGGTGSGATWADPYVEVPLFVWEQGAIDGIEQGAQKELSSSYYYDCDMTPGEWNGQAYDGVMRNLRGNHVALVERGRAGHDCCVGDEALPEVRGRKFVSNVVRFVPRNARRFAPLSAARFCRSETTKGERHDR